SFQERAVSVGSRLLASTPIPHRDLHGSSGQRIGRATETITGGPYRARGTGPGWTIFSGPARPRQSGSRLAVPARPRKKPPAATGATVRPGDAASGSRLLPCESAPRLSLVQGTDGPSQQGVGS